MSDINGIGIDVDDPTEPAEEPRPLRIEDLSPPPPGVPHVEEPDLEVETEVSKDPLADLVFDEGCQEDFEGLLHLGELRYEFVWANHTFLIRTLRVDELLQVVLLTAKFSGGYGADRAYVTALVAAALIEVDGVQVYTPTGPADGEDRVAKKYDYIRKNWYSQTIDAVYSQLQRLEARAQVLLDAMGEA